MSLKRDLAYDPLTGVFTRLYSSGRWKAGSVIGGKDHGYVRIVWGGRRWYAHNLAALYMTGIATPMDHRDGDGANNRWANLRPATQAQNLQNQAARGVSFDAQRGKWEAYCKVNRRKHSAGRFDTEADALIARAALKARLHLFQPFDRSA